MKYLILGDVHAKWVDLNSVMKNVDFNLNIKYNAVIQVGDFGFFKSCIEKLDTFHEKIDFELTSHGKKVKIITKPLKFHKPIYAIDGNHEDHEFIVKSDIQAWKDNYNIYYQPRGSYLDIEGFKIGFIGGALHADRPQHGSTAKKTTNYILNKEVAHTIEMWNSVGGVDVIISHSCPNRMGIGVKGHPALIHSIHKHCVEKGFDPGDFDDCGELPLKKLYEGLNKKPKWWFFGHFHSSYQKQIEDTTFWCVGSTDTSDHKMYINPIILDTKTNNVEFINKKALNFDGMHSTRIL